jgi:two-component system chemotaxis response regulator CheY
MENGKKSILVVDDSRTMRQLLIMLLKKALSCDVMEAEDGLEAVEKLGGNRFDLVITDINMPRMNGLSLIQKIRSEMGLKVPIIIVTTMGKEEDRDTGLKLGADNYITKPVHGNVLTKMATELIG